MPGKYPCYPGSWIAGVIEAARLTLEFYEETEEQSQ